MKAAARKRVNTYTQKTILELMAILAKRLAGTSSPFKGGNGEFLGIVKPGFQQYMIEETAGLKRVFIVTYKSKPSYGWQFCLSDGKKVLFEPVETGIKYL